jgi:hypothetical protein
MGTGCAEMIGAMWHKTKVANNRTAGKMSNLKIVEPDILRGLAFRVTMVTGAGITTSHIA